MKRKATRCLFCILAIILCFTSIGYGSYVIFNKQIGVPEDILNPSVSNIRKITFKNGNDIVDTQYLSSGQILDASNTPTIGSDRIQWKDSSGNVKIDLCDPNKLSYNPIGDEVLIASVVAPLNKIKGNFISNNTGQSDVQYGNYGKDKRVFFEEPKKKDSNKICNDIEIGGTFDDVEINARIIAEKSPGIYGNTAKTWLGNALGHANQANKDSKHVVKDSNGKEVEQHSNTIGLEDPTYNGPEDYYHQPLHKDVNGNLWGNNNCINRITLTSDLYLKNSTFDLGGATGFYGDNSGWSQRNMQGYIIGAYSELDLNGHNLIIGNGSTFNSFGSITNSKETGKVIVNSGGTLLSSIVVEEHNCERALPIQYYYGGEVLSYYKMPYLNCDITIEQGGCLLGELRLDFGGGNGNYFDDILPIIGPSNNYIIEMSSTNGYIERNTKYDLELYKYSADFAKRNLMHQVINYNFYNCNIKLNTTTLKISISVSFNLDLAKNGYIIAPYFRIFLYNTSIDIPMSLTFLPGSYLFADNKSVINLSSSGISTFNGPTGDFSTYDYQTVGSLNFVQEKYDFRDAVRRPYTAQTIPLNSTYGWVDDSESAHVGSNGSHMLIRYNATEVTKYLNINKPAKADIFGKITFSNIISYNENSLRHQLGGNININDVETFKNVVNQRNDVDLFSSRSHFGPCYANIKPLKGHVTNVTDFFISPMISNNNVLMDKNDQTKVRNDYKYNLVTYDKKTGLVQYSQNEYYAFIHTDASFTNYNKDIDHVNKSLYDSTTYNQNKDSYYGKFFKVNKINNYIECQNVKFNGNSSYCYFRGTFVPYYPSSSELDLDKFTGAGSNLHYGFNSENGEQPLGTVRHCVYDRKSFLEYDAWRLG